MTNKLDAYFTDANPACSGVLHDAIVRKTRAISFNPSGTSTLHSSDAVRPPRWKTRKRSSRLSWLNARTSANNRGRPALNRPRAYADVCTTISLHEFLTFTGIISLLPGLFSGGFQEKRSFGPSADTLWPPVRSGVRGSLRRTGAPGTIYPGEE